MDKPPTTQPISAEQSSGRKYLRFTLVHRIEHWIFMLSFSTLGLTGLVQKYAGSQVSIALIAALGGIETTRYIHRIAAIVMMLGVIYHIGALGFRLYVQRLRPTMLPGMYDLKAAIQAFTYNLGLAKTRPQQGRYTFEEKAEYWAVVWGTVIMVITGFMMWNPIATSRFMAGGFIPAAKAAHGGEALLAVLAIIIWHLYHVLVRHVNRSMFNGYLTEQEMLHEHPLELADLKAGVAALPPDPQGVARRRRTFLPAYSVIAVLMLVGVYFFISMEVTALTIAPPPEQVEVFVPLPPTPLPTLAPSPPPAQVASLTWEGGVGALLQAKCGSCHSASSKLGGLDMSTYQGALTGGASGAAIIPEDPQASQLVVKQAAGGHPGQLSPEELAQMEESILAGAQEK